MTRKTHTDSFNVFMRIVPKIVCVSSVPRIPIEEAVDRKTLAMREGAPTKGTE